LVIDSVDNLGLASSWVFPNLYRYRVNYSHTGIPLGQDYVLTVEGFTTLFPFGWNTIGVFNKTEGEAGELIQEVNGNSITKIRITIEAVTSSEFDL